MTEDNRIADLYNNWRELGWILESFQPGLTCPLPDEDPSIVDALKLIALADDRRRKGMCV